MSLLVVIVLVSFLVDFCRMPVWFPIFINVVTLVAFLLCFLNWGGNDPLLMEL